MIEVIKEIARLQEEIEENNHDLIAGLHHDDGASVLVYSYEKLKEVAGDNPIITEYQEKTYRTNMRYKVLTKLEGVVIYTYLTEEEYKNSRATNTTK